MPGEPHRRRAGAGFGAAASSSSGTQCPVRPRARPTRHLQPLRLRRSSPPTRPPSPNPRRRRHRKSKRHRLSRRARSPASSWAPSPARRCSGSSRSGSGGGKDRRMNQLLPRPTRLIRMPRGSRKGIQMRKWPRCMLGPWSCMAMTRPPHIRGIRVAYIKLTGLHMYHMCNPMSWMGVISHLRSYQGTPGEREVGLHLFIMCGRSIYPLILNQKPPIWVFHTVLCKTDCTPHRPMDQMRAKSSLSLFPHHR